jgi:hypothetical protein
VTVRLYDTAGQLVENSEMEYIAKWIERRQQKAWGEPVVTIRYRIAHLFGNLAMYYEESVSQEGGVVPVDAADARPRPPSDA